MRVKADKSQITRFQHFLQTGRNVFSVDYSFRFCSFKICGIFVAGKNLSCAAVHTQNISADAFCNRAAHYSKSHYSVSKIF